MTKSSTPKTPKKKVTFVLDPRVDHSLESLAGVLGRNKNELVDEALKTLFKKHKGVLATAIAEVQKYIETL